MSPSRIYFNTALVLSIVGFIIALIIKFTTDIPDEEVILGTQFLKRLTPTFYAALGFLLLAYLMSLVPTLFNKMNNTISYLSIMVCCFSFYILGFPVVGLVLVAVGIAFKEGGDFFT